MPRDTDFRDSDTFKNSAYGQYRNGLFAKSAQDRATEARKNGDLVRATVYEHEAAEKYYDARNFKEMQIAQRVEQHDDVMLEQSENQRGGSLASCCTIM